VIAGVSIFALWGGVLLLLLLPDGPFLPKGYPIDGIVLVLIFRSNEPVLGLITL
jgi:hypothetical protein